MLLLTCRYGITEPHRKCEFFYFEQEHYSRFLKIFFIAGYIIYFQQRHET